MKLTEDEYRAYAESLIRDLGRLGPGDETQTSLLAEGIGNVYSAFGDPSATVWYRRALELRSIGHPDPYSAKALLWWKLGELAEFREECRRIVEFNEMRMNLPLANPARMWREQTELMIAHFLLKHFERAAERAESTIATQRDPRRPGLGHALRDMANGLGRGNEELFESGMSLLRSRIREWPTYGSGQDVDLYRYALALRQEHFRGVR